MAARAVLEAQSMEGTARLVPPLYYNSRLSKLVML